VGSEHLASKITVDAAGCGAREKANEVEKTEAEMGPGFSGWDGGDWTIWVDLWLSLLGYLAIFENFGERESRCGGGFGGGGMGAETESGFCGAA